MDNAKETKNPLLEAYGTVVDRFFAPGRAVQDPVVLFPGVESASQVDELPYKPDLVHFTPAAAELAGIQHTVDNLRTLLDKEAKEALQLGDQKKKFDNIADKVRAVRGQAEGIQQVSFHLDAFRNALQTGDEALLKGNPFYALTKLIFWHHLNGSLVLFGHLLGELTTNAPEMMGKARSLRAIWQNTGQRRGLLSKLLASVGSLFSHTKSFLDGLLFFVSAVTSYRALLGLLQTPDTLAWFERFVTQSQGEALQVTLATLGSLLLGVAVLDLRTRLLQGIAESGAILAGLRAAFLLQPRWLLLASGLALFSITANYDSIAVLFSTRGTLSAQLLHIQQQVGQALGTPDATTPTDPRTLYDLQARLQAAVTETGERFTRIPEEELTGKSTSADPRKGPRYWAKHFIVNGGFVPGSTDVVHAFKNVQFARNMDQLLKETGLPLDLPVTQKLQSVAALYSADLAKTTDTVQKHLAELDRLMQVGTLSLSTIQKIYTFDNKQINQHLQEIVQAMQANRARFGEVVQTLDTLSESHLRALAQVDKSVERHGASLRISNLLTLPDDRLIGAPVLAPIQLDSQKNFAELAALLTGQHGNTQGRMLLAFILFCTFAIDLLPLLLFARTTARQGEADGQMAEEMLNYMKEWEDAFVDMAKSFFYRPAIQQTLRGVTFPNETGVRNAFFKVLEALDPNVKDAKDQNTMEKRRAWLQSLFRQPRSLYAVGYNARAAAIETLLSRQETCFPLLIRHLFPGLPYGKKYKEIVHEGTFLDYYDLTETGQTLDKEQFAAELKRVGTGEEPGTRRPAENRLSGHGALARVWQQCLALVRRIPLSLPRRPQAEEDRWTAMVQKAVRSQPSPSPTGTGWGEEDRPRSIGPLQQQLDTLRVLLLERAFREPYPSFPHTRYSWLLRISSVNEESLEDLDTLHDFIPDFVKMLKKVMTNTLPVIQESLEPLEEICARFPEQCAAHGIAGTAALQERFRALEKESLGMWGACVSHLLGDGSVAQLQAKDNPELAGLLAAGGDISQFYDRIHTLMNDAREAAQRAKAVEEATLATVKHSVIEIKELCDSINQMLVKINMLSLDLRRQRPLPHLKLRALNEGSSVLDRAPRDVKYILDARERVLASDNLYSDDNFSELSQLRSMAHALHNRVDNILNLVDK
ncbi:MAG: hypothetical protein H7838_00960 [Magnetococcus sp. DMHC-8]